MDLASPKDQARQNVAGTADGGTKPRGFALSLAAKVNLIVIVAIIVVSTGLLLIGARVYSDRIDEYYQERLENAMSNGTYFVDPEAIEFLWNCMQTEQFAQAHQQAVQNNDPTPLENWMASIDASGIRSADEASSARANHVTPVYGTLYDVFLTSRAMMSSVQESTGVTSVYIQFMKDGVTYNLIDPEFGVLYLGSVEPPLPEFAEYADNEYIPPTIYKSDFGHLCTTCVPISNDENDKVVAMLGLDADMTDALDERDDFLAESVRYVLLVMVIAMAASLFLIRRIATKPLRQLTEATCDSYDSEGGYGEHDVIDLPIRSNDEIGDLYREIRSMQGRITDYTRDMARMSAEEERVKTELQLASSIQESMIPNTFPAFPDRTEFDVFASMESAKDVGGDFYDIFLIDHDHLALVIADVSGKGVPAALFMMAVKIMIADRAQTGESPAEVLAAVNEQICANNTAKMFVTVWMGILDVTTGEITCVNAGHNYPWVRSGDGAFRMLRDKHGFVVGGSKKTKFTNYVLNLKPGDAIFVHTDGLNEAVNQSHEFFGIERLESTLNRHADAGPEQLLKEMQTSVSAFAAGADLFDDLTMLCVEYHGMAPATDELTLPATPDSVSRALEYVGGKLETLGCPASVRAQISVAIDEIVSNIVKFAYESHDGDITVRFRAPHDDVAQIEFIDRGVAYNPLDTAEPDTTLGASQRKAGGLGVFIVKNTMDEIEYEREDDQNILRIRKRMTS